MFKSADRQHPVLLLRFIRKIMFKSGLIGLLLNQFAYQTVFWAVSLDVFDSIGAPTVCLLQSLVGTLTCDSTNYQTVTSGRFCEDETMCTNQVSTFQCISPINVRLSNGVLVMRHLWRDRFHCWTGLRAFWSSPCHSWQYSGLVRMSRTLQTQWRLYPRTIYHWSTHWMATCSTMWATFYVSR